MPDVLMVMGSDSDFPTLLGGVEVLEEFGVDVDVQVASAHRTPERVQELVRRAEEDGTRIIIAAAGMAAHLAGVIAGRTVLPVIGVPMDSPHLSGLDSLYSTVMMPPGVPVASVGIGKPGARNAAYLALAILALGDAALDQRLRAYRGTLADKVTAMNENVQKRLRERRR